MLSIVTPPHEIGLILTVDPTDELERRFGDSRLRQRSTTRAGAGNGHGGRSVSTCFLRLYISHESLSCGRALGALRLVIGDLPPGALRVEIIDIAKDVESATEDRILFTPTLIFRDGSNRTTRLLGDLSNPALLVELLQNAGIAV